MYGVPSAMIFFVSSSTAVPKIESLKYVPPPPPASLTAIVRDVLAAVTEKSVSIFLGKTSETEYKIQEEEIEECGWYNYSEALEVLNYENDKYILNEAESFFASKSC